MLPPPTHTDYYFWQPKKDATGVLGLGAHRRNFGTDTDTTFSVPKTYINIFVRRWARKQFFYIPFHCFVFENIFFLLLFRLWLLKRKRKNFISKHLLHPLSPSLRPHSLEEGICCKKKQSVFSVWSCSFCLEKSLRHVDGWLYSLNKRF